ncbi:purine and uridine phosphorylase [Nemania sp. FL0916]|nr:purine and uridine phosphorylase [Nemania sp. FL0916]
MSAGRWDPSPPKGRHDFEIAIMCALPIEADAVAAMFDRRWDSSPYGTVAGDTNTYSTGAIGRHNVVLVHLPNMGKVAAATAATFLRASYGCINLALVVGICGGVPFGNSPNTDIFLGDVVISDGVIQYDLGRRFPHGFVRKDHIQDNLPRPSLPVRTFLAKLQANETSRLREKTLDHLYNLQQKQGNAAKYLRPTEDWLFKPTYRHKHSNVSSCPTCSGGIDSVCSAALKFSCQELGCDEHELVLRTPSKAPSDVPTIHFGLVASGDLVMKSGEDRDRVASHDGAIAFEMEGAGAWEALPGCLIIKGVCDYADSHKNKIWQAYAAATAAATSKAALENWDTLTGDTSRPHFSHRPTPLDPWVIDTAPVEGSRRVAILKKLFTSPYRDRKERNPDRVAGTCEWFVAHERFQEWRKSPSSGMLFVSADPGCGKSVLAKYLVDSELSTIDSRTTCYFFFKDDFEDQRSARSALCCILHQLFEQNGALLSSRIAERFETGGEHLTSSFVELWEILITVSQNKNAGEIICILDAFDECEDQGQVQFVRYLKQLYGTQKHSDSNLKFLLTSRPYGHIKRGFQPLEIPDVPVIFLSGENEIEMSKIAKEIDIYIKARVRCIQESHKLESFEEDLLLQQLLRIPNRTYLWAHLTLDLVEKDIDSDIDKTRIKKVTSQLPRTVDEAYERILAKSLNIDDAQKLLHIVIAAARPLTLSEMNIALTIRETHQSYRDLDIMYERRFRRYFRLALDAAKRVLMFTSDGNVHYPCKILTLFFRQSASGTCFSPSLTLILYTVTNPYPNTFVATASLNTRPRTGLVISECRASTTKP